MNAKPWKIRHVLLSAGLLWISAASVLEARPAAMRDLTVGVAVTPSFKNVPDWKSKFRKRLAYASKIFEREFRVRFKKVIYWDWDPSDPAMDMKSMIDDLMYQFPLAARKVDLVLGLSRLEDISKNLNMKDVDVLGLSRPFSGYTVLRYPDQPLFQIQEETVLVHELGHLFGAVHTGEKDTIMMPYVDRHIPTSFDPDNRQIIAANRTMNFQQGTDSLNRETVQRLLDAYGKFMRTEQPFEFYYALAVFYLKMGNHEDGLKALRQAAQMDSGHPRVHFDIGILLSRMDQPEEARKALETAVSKMTMPAYNPDKAAAYNIIGGIYFRQGNYEGAQYAWQKALRLTPDNLDIQVNLASVQIKRGQAETARKTLEAALQSHPDNAKILSNLGAAYYEKGDYQKAISYLKRALAHASQSTAGAVTPFESIHPATVYAQLGAVYYRLNQKKEAIGYFQKSCAMDTSVACHEQLGRIYFDLKDWDNVIGELADVVPKRKEDPSLYGMLGVALYQKGNWQQAIAVFKEGLGHAADPQKAAILHRNLGHIYLNTRQVDHAVSEFQYAVSGDWHSAEAHYGLALAYLAKGEKTPAYQSCVTILSFDPKHKQAKELMRKIQSMEESMRVSGTFSEG